MTRFTVGGSVTRYIEAEGETLEEAVARWKDMAGAGYPSEYQDHGTDPEDEGEIIGGCEGCSRVIIEGEKYSSDEEGCLTCWRCLDEWAKHVEAEAVAP